MDGQLVNCRGGEGGSERWYIFYNGHIKRSYHVMPIT